MSEIDSSTFRRISPLRRVVKTACKVMKEDYPDASVVMVTLTYAEASAWTPRHISEYRDKLSKWLRDRGARLRYLWVMELQARGAPHYHILLWLPKGLMIPFPDQYHFHPRTGRLFGPMWPHGSSNVRRGIRHGAAYLAKYLSKIRSKAGEGVEYPRGARIYGLGGMVDKTSITTWARAPRWARLMVQPGDLMRAVRASPIQPHAIRMRPITPGRIRTLGYREFYDEWGRCAQIDLIRVQVLSIEQYTTWTRSTATREYRTFGGEMIGAVHKARFYTFADRLAGFFRLFFATRMAPHAGYSCS